MLVAFRNRLDSAQQSHHRRRLNHHDIGTPSPASKSITWQLAALIHCLCASSFAHVRRLPVPPQPGGHLRAPLWACLCLALPRPAPVLPLCPSPLASPSLSLWHTRKAGQAGRQTRSFKAPPPVPPRVPTLPLCRLLTLLVCAPLHLDRPRSSYSSSLHLQPTTRARHHRRLPCTPAPFQSPQRAGLCHPEPMRHDKARLLLLSSTSSVHT